jgi:hypothetical protein
MHHRRTLIVASGLLIVLRRGLIVSGLAVSRLVVSGLRLIVSGLVVSGLRISLLLRRRLIRSLPVP